MLPRSGILGSILSLSLPSGKDAPAVSFYTVPIAQGDTEPEMMISGPPSLLLAISTGLIRDWEDVFTEGTVLHSAFDMRIRSLQAWLFLPATRSPSSSKADRKLSPVRCFGLKKGHLGGHQSHKSLATQNCFEYTRPTMAHRSRKASPTRSTSRLLSSERELLLEAGIQRSLATASCRRARISFIYKDRRLGPGPRVVRRICTEIGILLENRHGTGNV